MIAHLLKAKRRVLVNYLRAEEGGMRRVFAILFFGLLFWLGLIVQQACQFGINFGSQIIFSAHQLEMT